MKSQFFSFGFKRGMYIFTKRRNTRRIITRRELFFAFLYFNFAESDKIKK